MPNMETGNSNVSRAEEIKVLANEAFKAHKYGQAIDLYSQAIELNGDNAVYWANRAFAHSKLEEYGSAIQDASKAIEIDPKYSKAKHIWILQARRCLSCHGQNQRCSKGLPTSVKKLCPNDPDASKKLKECEKAVMKLKFEEAIAVPESQRRSVAESIDFHSIDRFGVAIWMRNLILKAIGFCSILYTNFIFNQMPYFGDWMEMLMNSCLTDFDGIKGKTDAMSLNSAPISPSINVLFSIYFIIIGTSPSSSSVPTQVALAPVAVAVVAAAVMLVGTAKPAVVVSVLMVILVVLGAYLWGSCRGSGVFTKRGIMDLDVEPQYSGARIEGDIVTLDFVKKMMDDFKNQKCIHKRYAFQIVLQTREMLQALPSLVDINVPEGKHFTVCGDVHGQFYDLLNIFKLNGLPSEGNPYLFNGDFVDRGSFSLEVILTLFAFKCMCPSAIYLSRGNHESKSMNKIYGFEGEVRSKLSETFVELFAEVFCCLPLAHVINGKVFVVHGGLFSVDGVKLSDIRAIDRFCEPPEEGLMCELLWSDPQPFPGRGPSKRGVGLSFGKDVTQRFLQDNNLDLVVRSHEVKDEGYEIEHDGKLITVFSAPNYCDQMGNKGAFIRFEAPDLKPNIVTFSAVPHPDVKPMAYANNFMRMFS
ncbi:hypothetical protein SADUNF_Sadunf14G0107100 [Salix dunnii]|uniref:Serine/threonine-protein phosphatase 5 n=1 Tax=Salix dunnii TaxID=1413687 RepID=A0A835JFT2_9ROSI|nr:hypothetical protein SADUNF_Sadunf14G0107100 [Salix dunnii]